MALLGGTIALLIYIAVIVLIFKFVKSVIKTVLLAILVLMVVSAGSVYFVYNDAKDLQENFMNSSKRVLLADGEQVLAGFEILTFNEITFIEENLTQDYLDEDYKSLLGDNYKLIVLDLEIFNETMQKGIEIPDMGITLDEGMIKSILYSENGLSVMIDEIINVMVKDQDVPEEMMGMLKSQIMEKLDNDFADLKEGDIKSMIVGLLLKEKIEVEGAASLVKDYRAKKINIYPYTAVFRMMRFAPSMIVNKAVSIIE